MIHQLKRQGLSIQAISYRTGLDRKTVRKYLENGLDPPSYGPRKRKPSILEPYYKYMHQRLKAYPELTARRLLREIREFGYSGGYTTVKCYARKIRPEVEHGYEHRFETPPGEQAQTDFAHFKVVFADEPDQVRVVWLFSMILGFSRYLYTRFVFRQNLETMVRCHIVAFSHFGGVPREILYDRAKTNVTGENSEGQVIFNNTLLDLARHYGFSPRACAPYRAKTKGKVERPFRYIRQDFFLGRSFRNLEDLNSQLSEWLDKVANLREHGTTRQLIPEAYLEDQVALLPLPEVPYSTVLNLERRITRDGMVSVEGNLYSVPDTTKRRAVEVQTMANAIQIYDGGRLVAIHEPLEGRGLSRIAAGHRNNPPPGNSKVQRYPAVADQPMGIPGEQVTTRPLSVYESVGARLASAGGGAE
jgi:transposase